MICQEAAYISHSSIEAEYRALAQAAAELCWIQMLLDDLCVSSFYPILWCDNLSAISLSSNPVFHALCKHIAVAYHFIRERVASKQVLVKHITSSDQLVDVFTKPLFVSQFQFLHSKLMVFSPSLSLRGSDKEPG